MGSLHDKRYISLVEELVHLRKEIGVTQEELAQRISKPQSFVSKVETCERLLDIVELIDWCAALQCNFETILRAGGFLQASIPSNESSGGHSSNRHSVVVPVLGSQVTEGNNIRITLASGSGQYPITLENTTIANYTKVERFISRRFADLNRGGVKNREVIAACLLHAINNMPQCNPSDVYHHVVYRTFLREYTKTDPNQSWVRAGGEAVELFIQAKYAKPLAAKGIVLRALIGKDRKTSAIEEMGLSSEVSSSKLDLGLWGKLADGTEAIFGGIHVKASLAERVVDDIPASRAMMRKGYASILFTFDAKSFPPPYGDLVNYGEFGTADNPSDKRIYIEQHGAFDVALCYNTRIQASPLKTKSGKRILTSTMEERLDNLPKCVLEKWAQFTQARSLRPLIATDA